MGDDVCYLLTYPCLCFHPDVASVFFFYLFLRTLCARDRISRRCSFFIKRQSLFLCYHCFIVLIFILIVNLERPRTHVYCSETLALTCTVFRLASHDNTHPLALASPYTKVERNMRLRRKRVLSVLRPGEVAPTMTCFPLMGVGDYIAAPHNAAAGYHVRGPVANSAYVPDVIINPHPRFGALTRNIRVSHVNCNL